MPSIIFRKFANADYLALFAHFWKLERPGVDFKSRHVFTFSESPDLEAEAQSDEIGDGSLLFK